MRRILYFLLAAGAAASQTRPASPPPRYDVKRASAPIAIDGKLDEAAWAAADTIELSFPWDPAQAPKQKTTVRLLWDDNNLYVAYECEDADITAHFTRRDDAVDQDDSVLILVNPSASQTHGYIALEANARATLRDYLSVDGEYFFGRFDMQGIRLATYVDGTLNRSGDKDRAWTVEAAIPMTNFDDLLRKREPGMVWTANFGRWDGVAPNRSFSIWSDSLLASPSPHSPARFGQLVFLK
jgi:hypothetical protein